MLLTTIFPRAISKDIVNVSLFSFSKTNSVPLLVSLNVLYVASKVYGAVYEVTVKIALSFVKLIENVSYSSSYSP